MNPNFKEDPLPFAMATEIKKDACPQKTLLREPALMATKKNDHFGLPTIKRLRDFKRVPIIP